MGLSRGKLDRRIRIERATLTTDGSGAEIPAWSELKTVWAQRLTQRPVEAWRAGGTAATLEAAWIVGWSPTTASVTSEDRIVADGKTFVILGVTEVGRRDGIQIVGVAGTDVA
jgi:SPP1 family predicted phage head-tail adaptor